MSAAVWVRYLLGEGRAIRETAENRSAIWTGIGLVFLTSFARNYDQTFIGESPFKWLFGSLLFSLVSGSFLYAVVYGGLARWRMGYRTGGRPGFWSAWPEFMGLFWMTAPIAWLYAIPVERFRDPVSAAKANVFLLATVSLWRVLLMTRVLQCLTTVPFLVALCWVLLTAAVEVLFVFVFGGGFAQAIVRGMGGLRNSPAEEILFRATGTAFAAALWVAPIAFVLSLALRLPQTPKPLPDACHGGFRAVPLVVAALFWMAVSIVPQIELARNVAVEKLLSAGQPREALDFLARHRSEDFAPARMLPPKSFEYSVFKELPACFQTVQPGDPAWVRALLLQRLNEIMVQFVPPWKRKRATTPQEQSDDFKVGIAMHFREAEGITQLLNGLERIPEGRAWLATNTVFLGALQRAAGAASHQTAPNSGGTENEGWLAVSNRVHGLLTTAIASSGTNRIGIPVPERP